MIRKTVLIKSLKMDSRIWSRIPYPPFVSLKFCSFSYSMEKTMKICKFPKQLFRSIFAFLFHSKVTICIKLVFFWECSAESFLSGFGTSSHSETQPTRNCIFWLVSFWFFFVQNVIKKYGNIPSSKINKQKTLHEFIIFADNVEDLSDPFQKENKHTYFHLLILLLRSWSSRFPPHVFHVHSVK